MSYKILRLDDFGRGITFVNNKICFVKNALIGEEVEIEVINEKSKYLEAVVKKYISKSKERNEVKCPFYGICGGCNTMHFSIEEELAYKKNKIERLLRKYAELDIDVKDVINTDEFRYRNKITLKVKNGKIGYFKDKSYDLVNIDKCLICKDSINKVIAKLNKYNLDGINEVIIRTNYKDEILLYLIGNTKTDLSNIDIDNIVINDYKDIKTIKGNNYLIDKIGNLYFKVSYNSFFQVNKDVYLLYDKVKEYAKDGICDNILDLYCGTGTIGIYLSDIAKNIVGVEINKNAVKDAEYNININDINNVEFICKDVNLLKNKFENIDLVIVDPPRSGLDNNSIYNLLNINSKRIIYVSCDPVTLSRDLGILKEYYDIKEISIINMFPNTYHCESITVLERR